MRTYFHFCSKGFKSEILYNTKEEFIAGMNRIAVCLAICLNSGRPVVILAFCLMDNHFHFILWGEEEDCDYFAENYKKLTAMWVSNHRGEPLSEPIEVGHWHIARDKVSEKISYVLRNPLAAGMRVSPQGYRWSSASLMFSDFQPEPRVQLSSLSTVSIKRRCSTKVSLPGNWLIVGDMVWPGSYVDFVSAEKAYRSVGSFLFELNNSNLDKETEEEMMADSFSLPDADIRIKAVQLAIDYFRKDKLSTCTPEERLKIARLLRKDLNCNSGQLARVLHLKKEDLQIMV